MLETNDVNPGLLALLAAPFIGSLLGVLIERLPAGRPVVLSRSECDTCHHRLAARDLVPLLSFALTRGRCRHCDAPISRFHPIIELAALGVAGWALLVSGDAMGDAGAIWIDCGLGWTLLTLAWIDYRHLRLPDALTLPLLVAGLAVTSVVAPDSITDHAAAAIAGYAAFRLISLLYVRLRGREGLGAGDAKLLAAGGAWLGLEALPTLVFTAACLGLLVMLGAAFRGRRISAQTAIPFGPCLAMSIWLFFLYYHDRAL